MVMLLGACVSPESVELKQEGVGSSSTSGGGSGTASLDETGGEASFGSTGEQPQPDVVWAEELPVSPEMPVVDVVTTGDGTIAVLSARTLYDAAAMVVYTAEGELAWSKTWTAERLEGAVLSSDGTNIAVAFVEGSTFGFDDNYRYIVFEPGGGQLTTGTGEHLGFDLEVELVGDAVVVGTSTPVPTSNGAGETGGAHVVAHRRGQAGPVWTWTRPGVGASSVLGLAVHFDGTVFVLGSQGGVDAPRWITRLSASGEELWSGELPPELGVGEVAVLPEGNVALLGAGVVNVMDVEGNPVDVLALPNNVDADAGLLDQRDGAFLMFGSVPDTLGEFAVGVDTDGEVAFEVRDEDFYPTGAAWLGEDVVVAGLSMDRASLRVSRLRTL